MNPITNPALKGLILFFSSGSYLGYIPLASGTFGTLWGFPLFYFLSPHPLRIQVPVIIASIALAIFFAGEAEKHYKKKDPSTVVIDEIVGYMVTVAGIPFSWTAAILGFFIFRFMDIFKPYPIRKIDQTVPGGWGIVLDDVLAGIYSQCLLRLCLVFLATGKA